MVLLTVTLCCISLFFLAEWLQKHSLRAAISDAELIELGVDGSLKLCLEMLSLCTPEILMAAGVKAGPALLLNARAIGEHKLISGTQNNARKPTIHANLLDSAYKKRQGLFDQLQIFPPIYYSHQSLAF